MGMIVAEIKGRTKVHKEVRGSVWMCHLSLRKCNMLSVQSKVQYNIFNVLQQQLERDTFLMWISSKI